MKIQRALLLLAIPLIFFSCQKIETQVDSITGFNSGSPPANEVWIQGMAFIPTTIVITAGSTIKFVNKDVNKHTVTADNNSFDSGTLSNGSTYSRSFNAGIYSYHCTIFPQLKGTVIAN